MSLFLIPVCNEPSSPSLSWDIKTLEYVKFVSSNNNKIS